MNDVFYTPSYLAQSLISYINKDDVNIVADFCVGDGELLRAVQAKMSNIKFIATDISFQSISKIKKTHSDWYIGRCDFLNKRSRNACRVLKKFINKIDLIILNPPFSCIGGTKYKTEICETYFTSSIALAFIAESIKYLSNEGCIYAILPESVAYSEKDQDLWNFLLSEYNLQILNGYSRKKFKGCSPNIIFVSINTREKSRIPRKEISISHTIKKITLFRGKISIPDINKYYTGKTPLVHTTNLLNNSISNISIYLSTNYSSVTGPAVLIPRVTNPKMEKICILTTNRKICISDCIIALETESLRDSKAIVILIKKNWKKFSELYKGTGARYTTLAKIRKFLNIP
jgi:tRNA1(Val) A37 N6-methylase TrmN6